jgi:hypothetical protein
MIRHVLFGLLVCFARAHGAIEIALGRSLDDVFDRQSLQLRLAGEISPQKLGPVPGSHSFIVDSVDTRTLHITLLGVCIAALIVSTIGVEDRFTWLLEVAPAMIAIVVLTATYRRFPFTNLVYVLILIHSIILMVGGH